MDLSNLIQRKPVAEPWAEGGKIPWDDPEFSRRMLDEHLSQRHDAASRRSETIDSHVDWIHKFVLSGNPARVLDLGCGPGLYTSRLAQLGHDCVGIDFSPASIEYAIEQARINNLTCSYRQADMRTADYGSGYDLAMLIFGEFNTFRPTDATTILGKTHDALADGGKILLEAHTYEFVQSKGEKARTWYSSEAGLFSATPHIVLKETFWDMDGATATERYYIIDSSTGEVARYAETLKAYTNDQYASMLQGCGFVDIEFHKAWAPEPKGDLVVITGRKRGAS